MTENKETIETGQNQDGKQRQTYDPPNIPASDAGIQEPIHEPVADRTPVEEEEHNQQIFSRERIDNFRFAGFWMRFWAYLIDLIVIGSIGRIILKPILKAIGAADSSSFFSPLNIGTALIFYLYFVLMTKYLSQTLGKMALGLKVISIKENKLSWGTVIFREFIGRFINRTILILYLLVGFLPKKQGLHDIFADTSVVHEN